MNVNAILNRNIIALQLVNLDDRQVCVLDLYSKYNDYQTRLNTSVAECHHLLMNCRLLSGDVNSFSTLIDKIIVSNVSTYYLIIYKNIYIHVLYIYIYICILSDIYNICMIS